MSIETLAGKRKIAKDLTGRHPTLSPDEKGEAFIGIFKGISQRQGDNGPYNAYLFEVSKGDMTVRVSKEEARVVEAGDVVSASGKSFDDIAGSLTLDLTYGVEFLGELPAKKNRIAMRLFRIVELGA